MADRIGQQLGNYQLLRELGTGGQASVYLGEHIHLSTQAAIKVLHTQLTSNDVDKFRTEARIIARLIHPHIVRVLDFGIESKTPFPLSLTLFRQIMRFNSHFERMRGIGGRTGSVQDPLLPTSHPPIPTPLPDPSHVYASFVIFYTIMHA